MGVPAFVFKLLNRVSHRDEAMVVAADTYRTPSVAQLRKLQKRFNSAQWNSDDVGKRPAGAKPSDVLA